MKSANAFGKDFYFAQLHSIDCFSSNKDSDFVYQLCYSFTCGLVKDVSCKSHFKTVGTPGSHPFSNDVMK